MGDRITYVGLDVHKEGIVVAVAEGGVRGEVREYGRIANTPTALRRLAGKLCHQGVGLRFCYEAGPCGYGIQRQLSQHGHEWCCQVNLSRAEKPKAACAITLRLPHSAIRSPPRLEKSATLIARRDDVVR